MRTVATLFCAVLALGMGAAYAETPSLVGDYLEVRSCDVYTGPCFANGEMGQTGKEAIMVWRVREGVHDGAVLDGLAVMAVVRVADTLGDLSQDPQDGQAALILDDRATPAQRAALTTLARELAGDLIKEVKAVETASMEVNIGTCNKSGCASAKAGDLVDINTRCLGNGDHICGNESAFYPPLTPTSGAYPVFTELASYAGDKLGATWASADTRSAYIATFTR